MNHNPRWEAFEGVDTLSKYSEETLKEFALSLIDLDDNRNILEAYASVKKYAETLSDVLSSMQPTVVQIMMNEQSSVDVGIAKITYVPRTKYNYEESPIWRNANADFVIAQDAKSQIEELLKKGGTLNGFKLSPVSKEVIDSINCTLKK